MNLPHRHGALRVLLLALLWAGLVQGPARAAPQLPSGEAQLTVHFFDVGQGDAALLESPTGKTVLVDGGPPEAGPALLRRVQALVHGPLDLVILTHPHLDHLGGLARVLQSVGARRFMDPGFDHPGKAYTELLETLQALNIPYVQPTLEAASTPATPWTPLVVGLGGGATLTVLWPRRPREPFLTGTRSDVNSNSIVLRVAFGATSLLLAGDAEPETEARLLADHAELVRSDLLKVGHHGSHHSTTEAWLKAVRPSTAIISCGAHNDFGHPGKETLERLAHVGARVLRTDEDGEVVARSDGTSWRISSDKGPVAEGPQSPAPVAPRAKAPSAWSRHSLLGLIEAILSGPSASAGFAASVRSPVFHRGDCAAVLAMDPSHRVYYRTREEAAREHRPAKDCHP